MRLPPNWPVPTLASSCLLRCAPYITILLEVQAIAHLIFIAIAPIPAS